MVLVFAVASLPAVQAGLATLTGTMAAAMLRLFSDALAQDAAFVASTTTVDAAGCSAATPLKHQDQVPGLYPGKRPQSYPRRLLQDQSSSTDRSLPCQKSLPRH